MQLHAEHHKHRFTPSPHPDAATLRATAIATTRARHALCCGLLISPGEAMALACGEARSKETLFTIARAVAFETGCDMEEIEARLAVHFPDLAK